MASAPRREFDVVVFGATGFTGKLVAEYLASCEGPLSWAIAGRSEARLRAVAGELKLGEVPIVIADVSNPASVEAMAERARVVITTVGPYALYGTPLIEACARLGTHYCDLTGEAQWMASIYEDISALAKESGARLVHCCGFDAIPSDLGVFVAQQTMLQRHGCFAQRVSGRMGKSKGAASGGTVASMMVAVEQASRDSRTRKVLLDPYSLYPADIAPGQDKSEQNGPVWDERFDAWTAPFIMAPLNTKVVRRSNALADLLYGASFQYDESMLCRSRGQALMISAGIIAGVGMIALPPTRYLMKKALPDPGEGPDAALRERGFFEFFTHANHPDDSDNDVRVRVYGKRDPGYGATSRMLAESGLCLAFDNLDVGGGIWTPASALGWHLVERLKSVDITFEPVL